ncbi:hypothetical protein [Marinobacter nauticus]|nr:hypothetical protein [Marinobacter nauticus]
MHPTVSRMKTAIASLEDESVKKAAAELIAGIEANITPSTKGVPYSAIERVKELFGISDQYILFGEGNPVDRMVSTPPAITTDSKNNEESHFKRFAARLSLMLTYSGMPLPDIAKALEVSRQSPHTWRTTGQISKDNLKKLCAIEGVDYDWVKDGTLNSDEARYSVKALYERARQGIEEKTKALEVELERCKEICAAVILPEPNQEV